VADLSFVVFSEQSEFGAEIRELLEATGHARVARLVSNAEELVEAVREHRPDAVFADLGLAPHSVIDLIDAIPAPRPQLVVCGPQDHPDVILRAMKQGVKEYLAPELDAAVIEQALGRLLLESRPADPASKRKATVIAVMGAKGGVGSTTVACQTAASLQETGAPTVVIDLDFPFGDVAVHFDVSPRHSIANLADSEGQIDSTYLETLLHRHESGIQILAGPTEVTDAQNVRADQLDRALDILREDFDWIVIDISHSWYEISAHVLDVADQILLVASMDVPTLNRARRHLELMRRLGHSGARTHVVVNRRVKTDEVSTQDVSKFLGTQADLQIPNDYATLSSCVNQGTMVSEVSPGRALHRAYRELARKLYEWNGLTPPVLERTGLLSRLRGSGRSK
jgi:pilus assembly protein CpaE